MLAWVWKNFLYDLSWASFQVRNYRKKREKITTKVIYIEPCDLVEVFLVLDISSLP